MKIHTIGGHQVNSSFDFPLTETLLRSFMAITKASTEPGFDQMPAGEQDKILEAFYASEIPKPFDGQEGFRVNEPIALTLDDGRKVMINASNGQYFVLLEAELLSFTPLGK